MTCSGMSTFLNVPIFHTVLILLSQLAAILLFVLTLECLSHFQVLWVECYIEFKVSLE
jgi:hypothetical protein